MIEQLTHAGYVEVLTQGGRQCFLISTSSSPLPSFDLFFEVFFGFIVWRSRKFSIGIKMGRLTFKKIKFLSFVFFAHHVQF